MAEQQEPNIAEQVAGRHRGSSGVAGSATAVVEKLKGSIGQVAQYTAKIKKDWADVEKTLDRIASKARAASTGGGGGGGAHRPEAHGTGGGSQFGMGKPSFGGSGGGARDGDTKPLGGGGGGGIGKSLGLGGFGGGGGGGGGLTGPGATMAAGAGKAAIGAAARFGAANGDDAQSLELVSARLASAGGGNRESWRGGMRVARLGGYTLQDNMQASLILSNMGQSTNSAGYRQLEAQTRSIARSYGGVSATEAATAQQQFQSTQSIYGGRSIGINTTNARGVAKRPDEIADQILANAHFRHQQAGDDKLAETQASLQQGGGFDSQIDKLSDDPTTQDLIRQSLQDKSSGKPRAKTRNDTATKQNSQSHQEMTSLTAKGITDATSVLNKISEQLHDIVNALVRGTHTGYPIGAVGAVANQVGGPTSSLAGIAPVDFRSNSQEGGPGGGATGWKGIEDAVTKLGIKYGPPTQGQTTGGKHASGSEHYAGRAVDFGDASSNPAQIAAALVKYATGPNAPIDELIYSPSNIGYKNGANVGEQGYGSGQWAAHRNHVHVGVRPGVSLVDVVSGTASTTASGGTTGGSADKAKGGGGFGGIINSAAALIREGKIAQLLGAGGGGAAPSGGNTGASEDDGDAGGGDATTSGPNATGDMQSNARAIIGVAKEMHLPKQAGLIGLMTALTESGLINVNHGLDDSLGLFQQRGSWGTAEQRMNPHYAAQKFYSTLQGVSGWDHMDPWMAAQKVQRSAYASGSNYHAKLGQAESLLNQIGYAQGAWEVQRDEYARIHKGEMIIPAEPAEQVRRSSTGGSSSGGSPVTINVTLFNASESEMMRLVQRVKQELENTKTLDLLGAT